MSDGASSRLELLGDVDRDTVNMAAAAQLLGLERRQVFRLLKAGRPFSENFRMCETFHTTSSAASA